jgi:hypothetical protein
VAAISWSISPSDGSADDLGLVLAGGEEQDLPRLQDGRHPIVTASRGTFSSPKKSAAASFRVTRSRVMSRVRLSSPEPGSLKPM